MENPAVQSLSDEQKAMASRIEQQLSQERNPDLMPSPYLWTPQYTSPAFDNYNSLQSALRNQVYYNSMSNQFNSALTQPLGEQAPQLGGRSYRSDDMKWELQGGMYGQNNPFEYNFGRNPLTEIYKRAQEQTEGIPIVNKIGIKVPKVFGSKGRGKNKNKKNK